MVREEIIVRLDIYTHEQISGAIDKKLKSIFLCACQNVNKNKAA